MTFFLEVQLGKKITLPESLYHGTYVFEVLEDFDQNWDH